MSVIGEGKEGGDKRRHLMWHSQLVVNAEVVHDLESLERESIELRFQSQWFEWGSSPS